MTTNTTRTLKSTQKRDTRKLREKARQDKINALACGAMDVLVRDFPGLADDPLLRAKAQRAARQEAEKAVTGIYRGGN
jgi:hypothetical protein